MATWRELISEEMKEQGEEWTFVVEMTLSEEDLDVEFNSGYGGSEGKPFTLWTSKRVYFPVVYDGAEWCGSVSRNPSIEAAGHFGGE